MDASDEKSSQDTSWGIISQNWIVGSSVQRDNPNGFKLLLVALTECAHLVTAVTGAHGPVCDFQWPWVCGSKQAHTHTPVVSSSGLVLRTGVSWGLNPFSSVPHRGS